MFSSSLLLSLGEMEEIKNDYEAIIEEFEAMTRDAGRVQREALKKILEKNGETEYLQSCGLDGRTDLDSFKACVPIASHKDLEPYIQRIADGDKSSILTQKPITSLSMSSGTSEGKPKMVPFNEELLENALQATIISFAFRNREYPIENGKTLNFIFATKAFKTKGGLTAGGVSSKLFRSSKFMPTNAMQTPYSSPNEVVVCSEFDQSIYCHLLCGLISRDEVHAVSSIFAHSIVQAFRTFELVWEELVTDIRQGTLSERITGPPVRSAVKKLLLKPDPELANMIYDTCLGLSKLNWYGLIQELFPNTKYVNTIMTGSMEPYFTKLRHYAGEGLPLLNGDYVSSEGYIAVNVNPKLPPELVTFTPLPNSCYYEFIPIKQEDSLNGVEPRPVGLTEVKVGDEYEIILTTLAGLYRYRLGDVVKVKGFHNSAPELQFIRRKDLLLSINIAKHTEKDLQVAVESAAKLLAEEEKQEVINFTSHVNSSTEPGHYVIFWELSGETNNETLKECCNCLDKMFAGGYILSRRNKAIGPLELRIVKSGTFHKIIDHYVGLGAAANQFKSPRCVGLNNTAVLQILSSNVVKSYFSTAY